MNLSPRERVIAQIEHRETNPIPYTLGFEGDSAERLNAHYGSDAWRQFLDNAIVSVPTPSAIGVQNLGETYYTDLYGTRWQVDCRPWHLVEPALKEPSLEGYQFPDATPLFEAKKQEAIAFAEDHRDHFVIAGMGFGLFERTWTLRGFEGALMDAANAPEFYDELVQQVADHQNAILDILLELPVDGIMFSDDWGYQTGVLLGPERWRRFLKPRLARMYERVHAAGKYALSHCCGSIADIMPDVIEIGLDVYQSVQPEARDSDPYELKRQYGDRITFWGGLGSQSTIPFGTPNEIQAEVGKLCCEMGRGGGYILGPAKSVQPETPTENAAAVVEAFLAQAGVDLGQFR